MAGLEGAYILELIGWDGETITLFPRYTSLEYTRSVNGYGHHNFGAYTLVLPAALVDSSVFELDYILRVWRRAPTQALFTQDFEGLHRSRKYTVNKSDTQVVSSGVNISSLLGRPIIRPPTGSDFWTSSGFAVDIMRDMVYDQMGPGAVYARQFPYITVPVLPMAWGYYFPDPLNYRNTNLNDELISLANLGIDYGLEHTTGSTIEFFAESPYRGADRRVGNGDGNTPVVFSMGNNNITDLEITDDRLGELTWAYVGGTGIGAAREVVEVSTLDGAHLASPWNRIETFIDDSSEENTAKLLADGQDVLVDSAYKKEFSFTVLPTPSCLYGVHYDLGDLVTAYVDGIAYDVRIAEINVVLSKKSGEEIEVTLQRLPDNFPALLYDDPFWGYFA